LEISAVPIWPLDPFLFGGFIGYQQHPLTLRPRWKQMFDPSAAAMDLANNATATQKSFG
jgi:hypothetical protein